jgi:hypothetical protein
MYTKNKEVLGHIWGRERENATYDKVWISMALKLNSLHVILPKVISLVFYRAKFTISVDQVDVLKLLSHLGLN